GEVRGTLIGQFAMSEAEGVLRVASTEGDAWVEGPGESESMITSLAESDGSLEEIGRVGGLGRGEEIYAVRFIGDRGYVVTFEQTDPLYTVDLSIPEDPEVTGELKIPGYSAYLHPVADRRLLGIGQDGTAGGTITGAQASLFDVADPEHPERLAALDLSTGRYGTSAAEWDHHAFLYSPEHALAVVPVQSYGREQFRGAVAVRVDAEGGLSEAARIEDPGQIERTLVVGENLVTVSTRGVAVRSIGDL
ncbi:MAG: beta-propeller domain-containing protein, partial [Actinomycetota bacterium]|nr:beta-propeller domain-containing protein [Actinomycetota bacterium]